MAATMVSNLVPGCSKGVWTAVQDVVGFSAHAQGTRLAVQLMRSLLLLAVLYFYRFGFAVGTAQVS